MALISEKAKEVEGEQSDELMEEITLTVDARACLNFSLRLASLLI